MVKLAVVFGLISYAAGAQTLTPLEKELLDRVQKLEARITALEAAQKPPANSPDIPGAVQAVAPATTPAEAAPLQTASGTTFNVYFDGYYDYNFNQPTGRANLLRLNDVLSNNLSLNQLDFIVERAPDVAAGRRFGVRADLMFGQYTESVQGNPLNEPRPQAYRNIFQAYGTYVAPIGAGLTVDFGKFASSFGIETSYAYEDINYSRSFWFGYLPYYHMGFRGTYKFNDTLSFQYWLINGQNQTEDFNGFKSNAFLFTLTPNKSVSWNINYYMGQDGHELTSLYNPGVPLPGLQPGLSTTPLPGPPQNGRSHIVDSYAALNATNKLTLAGEFDYEIVRAEATSQPSFAVGGAGYFKYQLSPKISLGGRAEYFDDHGGSFSGITQMLKGATATATYQPADGLQMRLEFRRDFSNRPFFLTDRPNIFRKDQNTATLGLIWWFGSKREAW